jgi:hypothetical protein
MSGTRYAIAGGLAVLLGLLGTGCGARAMKSVAPTEAALQPSATEAVIIFMRPGTTGQMYSSALFELRPDSERFIGILKSGTRLPYRVAPGRTRFMVVNTGGEDQFMDAELAGGKTYYAAVAHESIGARFAYVLKPVKVEDQQRAEFRACAMQCEWVENTGRSEAWARQHREDIAKRKVRFLPMWESRPNRPALNAADGR